jgi:hypothetical protein
MLLKMKINLMTTRRIMCMCEPDAIHVCMSSWRFSLPFPNKEILNKSEAQRLAVMCK